MLPSNETLFKTCCELKRQRDEAHDILKKLEWSFKTEAFEGHPPHRDICPICYAMKSEGHEADCELANVLYKQQNKGEAK
jgi:hypothetical protein